MYSLTKESMVIYKINNMQESNKKLSSQKKFQKEGKQHKMEKQTKKDTDSKEDKVDSIFIAQELIFGDEVNIGKWLAQFKQIKHANYDKLTDRILGNLKKGNFTSHAALDRFIIISSNANDQNTTGHQMASVVAAFGRFWRETQMVEADMQVLFGFIDKVYNHVARKYITIVRQLIEQHFISQFDYYAKQALNLVNMLLKANRIDENRILPLIYQFDLYGEVPFGKIVDLILRQTSINDSIYVFQDRQGQIRMNLVKIFVDRCTHSDIKSDFSKCETAIRVLKLDPFQYPQYITKMQERYICYLLRSFKLYYIQLIICHDKKLVSLLVEQLQRKGRHKESNYFILSYKLSKQFDVHFTQAEAERIGKIRNILLDNDQFGPTEVDVLEEIQDQEMEKNYLYLKDFGVREKDVLFIDSTNINKLNYKEEFKHSIGIDEERSGGTHVFDPPVPSILQIYNGKKVFIFDSLELGNHEVFKQIMTHIYEVCHIYGQDLQKQLTSMQKELKLDVSEQVLQELAANRVHDSSKMFKKVFPKETKSSLAYLCERIFKKTLSKFEQCSGWVRRPLRKAQLHYAALDCVLPYKLCQELAKMEKGQ